MVSTDTWGYLRFRISAREWGMWWTSAAPTVVVISQCAPVQDYYSTSETGVNLWQLYRDKHASIHNFLKGWGRKIPKSLLRIIETQCSRSFAKDNSRSFAKDLFIITVITTANMCWASSHTRHSVMLVFFQILQKLKVTLLAELQGLLWNTLTAPQMQKVFPNQRALQEGKILWVRHWRRFSASFRSIRHSRTWGCEDSGRCSAHKPATLEQETGGGPSATGVSALPKKGCDSYDARHVPQQKLSRHTRGMKELFPKAQRRERHLVCVWSMHSPTP